MKRRLVALLGPVLIVLPVVMICVAGCSHRPPLQLERIPPKIELAGLEPIGVVEFSSSSRGRLGPLATRRFTEMARRDQGLVRMVDLGSSGRALGSAGQDGWTPASYRAVGQANDVRTIVTGELTISSVKPEISLAATLRSGTVTARVDATLFVRIVEAESGASLWNRSASASRTVGHISVLRGSVFSFDADNPDEAYGDLVDALVEQVSRDFQATWVRR